MTKLLRVHNYNAFNYILQKFFSEICYCNIDNPLQNGDSLCFSETYNIILQTNIVIVTENGAMHILNINGRGIYM